MGPTATAGPAPLLEREHEVERVRGMLRAVGQQRGGVQPGGETSQREEPVRVVWDTSENELATACLRAFLGFEQQVDSCAVGPPAKDCR
jgi:hypothetical protein